MSEILSFTSFMEKVRALVPDAAIVVGSGMCGVVDRCHITLRLPFAAVPGLAIASVPGHTGCLTLADWGGKRVVLFEGRLHYYEGHPWRSVIEPVQIAHALGARVLLLTNAAGGIHDALGPGSLLAIRDHVEWTRPYCWRQAGPGPSRPSPYSPRLVQLLTEAASALGFELASGIYAAVTGPCYETPAEIRALKSFGADVVGMSTTREIQTGRDLGMECAAVSCITNRAAGLSGAPINHEEVLTTAAALTEQVSDLLEKCLQRL